MRTILILLGLAASAAAEIPIHQGHVVLNFNGQSCGGCALESLARYHGYDELTALARRHRGLTYPGDLERLVRQSGLRLWTTDTPDAWFLWRVTREQGAVVGFYPIRSGAPGHMVLLVELNGRYARYLDPDDGLLYTLSLTRFLERWDRSYCVPYR